MSSATSSEIFSLFLGLFRRLILARRSSSLRRRLPRDRSADLLSRERRLSRDREREGRRFARGESTEESEEELELESFRLRFRSSEVTALSDAIKDSFSVCFLSFDRDRPRLRRGGVRERDFDRRFWRSSLDRRRGVRERDFRDLNSLLD